MDINALPLNAISADGGDLIIGALARMAEVAAHPEVRRLQPVIAESLIEGASELNTAKNRALLNVPRNIDRPTHHFAALSRRAVCF